MLFTDEIYYEVLVKSFVRDTIGGLLHGLHKNSLFENDISNTGYIVAQFSLWAKTGKTCLYLSIY